MRPSRPLRSRIAVAAMLLPAVLLACGGDGDGTTVEPGPTPGGGTTAIPGPAAIPILGQGVVTDRYTAEVSARGPWVYTSTWGTRFQRGNVVYVWNAAGDRPVLADSLIVEGPRTTGDVQVSDDGSLLVVATEPAGEGSLVVYSLADPAHPRLITRYTSPTLAPGVHTAQVSRVNGRQYAFAAAPGRLVVVDLTTPAAPREVLSLGTSRVLHDTFVRDGILFTAGWDEGLMVWDVGGAGRGGSVSAPVRLGTIRTVASDGSNPSVHNVWWLHAGGSKRYVIVGEESAAGLAIGSESAGDVHVVDMSDLSRPEQWREVAVYRVPGAGTHNFVVDEARGILYAAFYNGGVRAVDVRGDLATCSAAQRAPGDRCDLRLMGRELGVALAGTPTTPDPRSGRASAPFVWGVDLAGDALYASDMMGGVFKLRAITR